MQNIINSVGFVEVINKIDNLINELLYSENSGFINLTSKDALDNSQKVLEKFNFEADKILKESSFSSLSEIINEKKEELLYQIQKHCTKEVQIWVDEVFNNMVDNCLLNISINVDNKELLEKNKNRIFSAIDWLSKIKNYSREEKNKLISSLNNKLKKALNSKDIDFVEKDNPYNSDFKLYFDLRNLITTNTKKFSELDFNDFKLKLSAKDILYFQKIQTRLNSNKTSVLDEIKLVDYAIKSLNLTDENKKYELINNIQDDFNLIKDNNYQEMIEKVKNRIEKFRNEQDYYKKLLGFWTSNFTYLRID